MKTYRYIIVFILSIALVWAENEYEIREKSFIKKGDLLTYKFFKKDNFLIVRVYNLSGQTAFVQSKPRFLRYEVTKSGDNSFFSVGAIPYYTSTDKKTFIPITNTKIEYFSKKSFQYHVEMEKSNEFKIDLDRYKLDETMLFIFELDFEVYYFDKDVKKLDVLIKDVLKISAQHNQPRLSK